MTTPTAVHATAVVAGETGVLIEGPSGSGKSALALALLAARPRFVRLVGDDRCLMEVRGGRLLARPHPAIAGLIERRGHGLVRVDSEPACVVGLVVLRGDPAVRLPDEAPAVHRFGIRLPACRIPPAAAAADAALQVLEAIGFIGASAFFEKV